MTNNEAAKWIQLYIDLARLDPLTGEAAYLNNDDRKMIEAMEMAINALTAQPETHDKRTETHACDLIDRRALMKEFSDFVRASNNSDFTPRPTWNDAVSLVKSMPPAQSSSSCVHENDTISRQAAIREYQEVCKGIKCGECPFLIKVNTEKGSHLITDCKLEAFLHDLPSAQPPARCIAEIKIDKDELAELVAKSMTKITEPDLQQTCNNLATDCISRKAAIDACHDYEDGEGAYAYGFIVEERLRNLPSAQPEPDWDYSEETKQITLTVPEDVYKSAKTIFLSVGYEGAFGIRGMVYSAQPSSSCAHENDTISRQAAIDAILEQTVCATKRELVERCDTNISDENGWLGGVCIALDTIEDLPSAQPDLSSYSDKLWRNAYERGRKEAMEEIIRCKDCKWGDWYTSVDGKRYCYCMETGNGGRTEDDFCSYAERQEE